MLDQDNTVSWKKAGLEPPHVYLNKLEQTERSSRMTVAEDGDDNLFAETQ